MNKRQTEILRILYKDRSYITLSEIADKVGVSAATVRNDIAAIRKALKQTDAGIIESKPHIGVRLVSSKDIPEKVDAEENKTNREIEFFILRNLFKENALTAQKLSQKYYIGRGETDKIVDKVRLQLEKNGVLFDRRRGKGITIKSSELNYRNALLDVFSEYADMYAELITFREPPVHIIAENDYTAVCAALDGFDASYVLEAIAETEKRTGIHFSYVAVVRLLFMVSLSVYRSTKNEVVEMPQRKSPLRDVTAENSALILAEEIFLRSGIKLPPHEIRYITLALAISEIQDFSDDNARRKTEAENPQLCIFTVRAARLISEITRVNLLEDRFFLLQMFLQLKATLARLGYKIAAENPLLSQIKAKYPNMMAVAWFLGNLVEKEMSLEINENEIAYIALHIGGAIERSTTAVKALIVCDYGVGISRILYEKISASVPEIHITGVFSIRNIRDIRRQQCDFIISAIPLEESKVGKKTVRISHIPSKKDIELIKETASSIRNEKKRSGSKRPENSIFSRELIFPQLNVKNKAELLGIMCAKLEAMGYVTVKFKKSVFEREESTPTDIGSGIAIPHGLSDYVIRSVAAFASLKNEIEWTENGERVDLIFLLAFDLSEKSTSRGKIINFYKSVVAMMENDEQCEKLRKCTSTDEIIKIFEQW